MDLRRRFESLPAPPPGHMLRVGAGTMADYHALAAFHYVARRPATVARVLRSADKETGSVVGVLIESYPTLACAARDAALHGRYRERACLLNREMRCVSRVVVHPSWRGLGVGVGLVCHALATASTRYTEALAAMGRVHPLFELAGMRRCGAAPRRSRRGVRPVYYLFDRAREMR